MFCDCPSTQLYRHFSECRAADALFAIKGIIFAPSAILKTAERDVLAMNFHSQRWPIEAYFKGTGDYGRGLRQGITEGITAGDYG